MFNPIRRHLLIPQGKTLSIVITFPIGTNLTDNVVRARIRKSETTDGEITTDNAQYVDPTVTLDVGNRTVTILFRESITGTLISNCTYSQLPIVKTTRQVDTDAIQKLATADLPGKAPYFWEVEWSNAAGSVEPLFFGGVLVPRESNR